MTHTRIPFSWYRNGRARRLAASISAALPTAALTALASLGISIGAVGSVAHANTFYVNTSGDPGPPGTLSLRQAIDSFVPGDVIRFDASLAGSTITLAQGALSVTKPIQLYGFQDSRTVTISGGNADRVFYAGDFSEGNSWTIRYLQLTQGHTTGCGGAIYSKNVINFIVETTITGSNAASGGGVCAVGPNAGIGLNRSRISGNSARLGGGVYLGNTGNFAIVGSSVSGNTALRAGGGLYVAGTTGASVIQQSLIAGNSVPAPSQYFYTSQGGGMVLAGIGEVYLQATTISNNSAYGAGGAVRILDATSADNTKMRNVTIAGNVALGGGAVSSSAGAPTIASSIVANNSGGDLAGAFSVSYSLIKDVTGAQITGNFNLFGSDPMLGPLADHGGWTRCMLPAAGSPVINAGGSFVPLLAEDQRGYPLLNAKDMGAVERQYPEQIIFRDSLEAAL